MMCGSEKGDLEHYLCSCEKLSERRQLLFQWWFTESADNIHLDDLLRKKVYADSSLFVRFTLDPSADADAIVLVQQSVIDLDLLFKLTRTFCFSIHKTRMQILNS